MVCSLDFTSLYGGLTVGAAFAAAAWAVWAVKYQPVAFAPARAQISGARRSRSSDLVVSLVKQARLRMEAGHDASDILERAIGLVRARRTFVIAVTMILWTAVMLALLQFVGGNSTCLRRLAEGEPRKLEKLAHRPVSRPARAAVAHMRLAPQIHMEFVHGPA